MNEMQATHAASQGYFFSCENRQKERNFVLQLDVEGDCLIISVSEECLNKVSQASYEVSHTIESLQRVHKFFHQFENVTETFSAVKSAITGGSYKLEQGEKEMFLIVFCLDREIKITIPPKPGMEQEKIMNISNEILELKEKLLKKSKQLEQFYKNFFKIKKRNEELIKVIQELHKNNEKLFKENCELEGSIKILKESRIEMPNTKTGKLLNNTPKTNEDIEETSIKAVKDSLELLLKFNLKLSGDLLNENTIAFDSLCKAYLCDWLLSNNKNNMNKRIDTVLLYKGSRDGDKVETFHKKCNNKGATLTLVESTTNFHFGGFTTVGWTDSGGYKYDSQSFLFSLDKKLKFPIYKSLCATYHSSSYGPTFGGGHDLCINNGCMNNENSYSSPSGYDIIDSFYFKVREIEVYQIIFQ